MCAAPIREDDLMLVNAYADGELDAAAALALERRMASDRSLQEAYDRIKALRSAMRMKLAPEPVSESFRRRIGKIALPERISSAATFNWRQLAASVVVAAVLGSGVTYLGLGQMVGSTTIDALVADHQRSLLATSPVDVASSDHHTVKPWFDQHLAVSPPVPDLSSAGFVLAGGRVEIIDGKAAPTLVYQLRKHLISVVAQPRTGGGQAVSNVQSTGRDGYGVVRWEDPDFNYYAVSDIGISELQSFVDAWRHSEPQP